MSFIELHRTFRELSEHSTENDDVDVSRAFHVGDRLYWFDLLKEYRLILLSEAGSGKTAEIRNIACTLREEGKPAFFLRLEHLSGDFEDAFEVGTYESFREWLASGEEGWLLLDSVDEARLRNPSDFELAIRKLSRQISTAKDRTHIVITGRTTAWRPKTDLAYCIAHLPYTVAATAEREPQSEDDDPEGSLQTETETQGRIKSVFKIVALDDLTSEQIVVFADARGIENSKAFLAAVERAYAWSFTSRPQDLEELTEFWIDKGRIGSRLELMQNSIERRLTERDQGRADARPLSAERARHGVRLLAAANMLVQNPTIRVPDGAENSKGIAVQSVLPDWDDKDQAALLSRPIFDEAIYGTVRFHHRSVREYLAAEWIVELLKRETSRRTIETLFFRNQYGLDIVVPTLRPILPWLVILDEKIREHVRKVAPEIIFEGGDPSQLPLEVRRYILHEVCEQRTNGATARSKHDDDAVLQCFANPDLTDDVRALLRQHAGSEDLTVFLLRLVWLGQLEDTLPEVMDIALTTTAEPYSRIAAFQAIKALGSNEDQAHVRQSLLTEASELKQVWLAELLKSVQPTEQTLVWLLACLEKTESKEFYRAGYLTEGVTEFVDSADIELLPQLVTGLNRLLSFSPVIERQYCEVSEKFQWLMVPASKAVERLILSRHPASFASDAFAVLHKFSAASSYGIDNLDEVKTTFSKLVPAWQELNRALFWFEVQRSREAIDRKHGLRLTHFRQMAIFGSFWLFEEGDFGYVAEEISRQILPDNRLIALSLAFNLYAAAKQPHAWRVQLKKLVADNKELSEQLDNYLRPPLKVRIYAIGRRRKLDGKGAMKLDERNKRNTTRTGR
jgi:cytidylate kinase